MTRESEKALAYFNHGFNCAQTVLYAFCEKYGLDKELASRLAGGLGNGFRSGDICGAVSGAVLVIGLKHGPRGADDMQAKQDCYLRTEEFIREFSGINGSLRCRDILGCDLSRPEGRAMAEKKNLFDTICLETVKSAIMLLEKTGY